jgi:hypothetical protein
MAAPSEEYETLDAIREEDGETHSEGETTTAEADDESGKEAFQTNTVSVSFYRRSWPQTAGEICSRYGKCRKLDGRSAARDFYKWNRIYLDNREHYDAHKQVLPWQQLTEDHVLGGLYRSTVWNGDSGLFDIDVNTKELEKIAERFDASYSPQKRRSARMSKESVLSNQRATVLSVVLRKLNLRPPKLAAFGIKFRSMSEAYFDQSVVDLLLRSSVWASLEELQAIKSRLKDGYDLAEPDALLWFLAVVAPNTRDRILALAVRTEFDDWVSGAIRAVSIMKSACMEVCTSQLLGNLFRMALMIGNRINVAHGGVEAVSS